MVELELTTDRHSSSPDKAKELQPKIVRKRIDALPALDMSVRMEGLTTLLADASETKLAPDARFALLELVDPEIHDLLSGYQEQAHHYAFPLSAQHHAVYLRLQTLLNHVTSVYKQLILDLSEQNDGGLNSSRLRDSIMSCIDYLTQQALQAYAVYHDAPPIWSDLHRLYAYAEKKQLAMDAVEHLADFSISGAYARALLLSIAEPGHLLQGEIYQTYDNLKKWGLAVRFEHPQELQSAQAGELLAGHYFCDLAGCVPPDFGVEGMQALPQNPRLLNLKAVLDIISDRMKKLALEYRRSLTRRAEWDLLLRLRGAWEKRAIRKEMRKAERGTTVKAVVSLSSCHYFFSGYEPFDPEKTEVRFHGDKFQQPQTLSLLSLDSTPWVDADTETKLAAGVIKPRAYGFDVESKEDDVWKKSHSNINKRETEIEKSIEERTLKAIYEFGLANSSNGGQGLETLPDSTVQLRVGELLALFSHGGDDDGDLVLNAVRWIQAGPDLRLHIGVHHIEGEPEPLAVRALDDQAIYAEYVRAFRIDSDKSSIIVPAGQFECGTTLVANDGNSLNLYKLENLLESTRAFSRFSFNAVELDEPASERIVESLKALLRREEARA